jgi:ribosomal protein L11 methyltransferase
VKPPERWLCLEVPAPAAGGEDGRRRRALVAGLVRLGGGAVEEEDGSLRTFLPAPDRPGDVLEEARRRLAEAVDGPAPEVRWRWVDDRDWLRAWRRGLGPRRPGERVVVAPSWCEPEAGPDDVVVRIDPGMAFGTGEHGTTRGSLRLLERAVSPGDRVLDVGTGSGVLAAAAAGLGGARVVALEKDVGAAETARENLGRNGVAGRCRVVQLEATPGLLRLMAPPRFDVVAANILAPVLVPLLAPFREVAGDEGRLILGGILEEEAEETVGPARRAGWRLEEEDRDDGWWTGLFRPDAG